MRSRESSRPIVRPLLLLLMLGLAGCAAASGSRPTPGSTTSSTGTAGAQRPAYKLGDRWIRSDGIYELAAATWREDPAIPLNTIQGYLRLSDEDNPELTLEQAARARTVMWMSTVSATQLPSDRLNLSSLMTVK